jgi:hypothetical protein
LVVETRSTQIEQFALTHGDMFLDDASCHHPPKFW